MRIGVFQNSIAQPFDYLGSGFLVNHSYTSTKTIQELILEKICETLVIVQELQARKRGFRVEKPSQADLLSAINKVMTETIDIRKEMKLLQKATREKYNGKDN